ncbi:hypothetical protein ACHAXS_004983 [Conticribra weissflogii]
MVASDKSRTFAHSIKISYANNILYQSSPTCSTASLATNSSPNLIFQCNITHLNSTSRAKSFALSSHLSASTNTNVYPWDSNVPLILPNKSWKKFYAMSMTPASTLMTLVPFPSPGNTTCCSWIKFYTG